jgi:enolase
MIMPDGAESFADAMRIGVEVSMQLKKRFKKEMPEAMQTGDLGGFCPNKSVRCSRIQYGAMYGASVWWCTVVYCGVLWCTVLVLY